MSPTKIIHFQVVKDEMGDRMYVLTDDNKLYTKNLGLANDRWKEIVV